MVYAGSATNVAVNNLALNTTYNVAVFSYAGSGSSTAYNRTPAVGSITIPPNQIWAQVGVEAGGTTVMFTANPGKWYWLQYSDSLAPPIWRNVYPNPVQATSEVMSIIDSSSGSTPQRFYRLVQVDPQFNAKVGSGIINALQYTDDSFPTTYVNGGKLGDTIIDYRPSGGTTWNPVETATGAGVASVTYSGSTNTGRGDAHKRPVTVITNGLSGALVYDSVFNFEQSNVVWTLNLTNLASKSMTIGDLALRRCSDEHSFPPQDLSGSFQTQWSSPANGSFIYWMRNNSVGPYSLMTPDSRTSFEYWDTLGNSGGDGYAGLHSFRRGRPAGGDGVWHDD